MIYEFIKWLEKGFRKTGNMKFEDKHCFHFQEAGTGVVASFLLGNTTKNPVNTTN
jgi:hypothetical protein